MIVAAPRFTQDRIDVVVRCDGSEQTLWYELSGDALPAAPPATADGIAVALLPFAMHRREALHIAGRVSRAQLAALEEYQDAWSCWVPQLFGRVEVHADEIVDGDSLTRAPERASSLAFSGGVDSSYQLLAHHHRLLGHRSTPIRRAVMVRGFDIPLDDTASFASATASAHGVVDRLGVPITRVTTNWREFCPHWELTFAAATAGVLHLFSADSSSGHFAADMSYGDEVVPWGSNSVTNPLLGSSAFRIVTEASGLTRTQRCAVIGDDDGVREHLRVCWQPEGKGRNCGVCPKCTLTKLNFRAAGFGDIPALGPLDLDAVRTFQVESVLRLSYLRDVADHEDALGPELARLVRRVLRRESLRWQALALQARMHPRRDWIGNRRARPFSPAVLQL
jgi:hypothetical protein